MALRPGSQPDLEGEPSDYAEDHPTERPEQWGWHGEFGRMPRKQIPTADIKASAPPGRDHNAKAFSIWMAGGGVKGGQVYGATDELGNASVDNKVHIHDLHATILHLLGFDHERLIFRLQGRDFRLTDVHGKVVPELLA